MQSSNGSITTASQVGKLRWKLASLVFIVCFVAYLDRITFSLAATPIMNELGVTAVQFGLVTSLFNVGYFLCQIPGGVLVQRLGPRSMMAISMILWSVFTAATGMVNSMLMLGTVRFFFGLGEGPVFTAANAFFASWFPSKERGTANSLMNAGAFLAPAVGPMAVVWVITHFGWRAGFFTCAVLGLVISVLWFLVIRDQPQIHSAIRTTELEYLNNEVEVPPGKPGRAPWKLLLRQSSFWTIALGYFGTMWTIQFFMYWLPYYLEKGRGVAFDQVGGYTGLAFLCITAAVLVAGRISDALVRKGASKYVARNLVCMTGLALAAIAQVISLVVPSTLGAVICLSIALGGAGVAQTTAWALVTDIGRQHTSTVGSWMNMWGFVAAAIIPTAAPIIAADLGWGQVMLVNAAVVLVAILGFGVTRANKPLSIE